MNEKIYQLFGIKPSFITGFAFSFPLAIINTMMIVLFLEVADNEVFMLSLIMLLIETVIYLVWRYYKTKELRNWGHE